MKATGGRAASRERRERLVQGKTGLPAARERSRTGQRSAELVGATAPLAAPVVQATAPAPEQKPVATESAPMAPTESASAALTGRDASRARRAGLVQGKSGLQQARQTMESAGGAVEKQESATVRPASTPAAGTGRRLAQELRAARARNGRGEAAPTRPSGRVRERQTLNYAPKVADSETYSGKKVTGVRIGRGMNVTGDENGSAVQVTGSQYVGRESGFNPREGGVKVGASRTAGGQVVTGSQVRNKIMITGDEPGSSIRITGESDQNASDDLIRRLEQGGYASAQFQRQHNPHGHTVFGTNLGRSVKSVGSRSRDAERMNEQTDGGQPISGTAVGRSIRVTGDEAGSCRPITGDQYLMPAGSQPLCAVPDGKNGARAGAAMAMNGRPDPVTGEKVTVSETWSRHNVTGVDVEQNSNVTGDEHGTCSTVTGTPYVGPAQYETWCDSEDAAEASGRMLPGAPSPARITGDTAQNVDRVTGTQRGGDRDISGTPYYREDLESEVNSDAIKHLNSRFSVRSPQREAQLQADTAAVEAPSAEGRITGSFAVGEGKITGNQEFHFSARARGGDRAGRVLVTGEGRVEGPTITGSAWGEQGNVTGTEGYIAAERNPSQRSGGSHAFAGAGQFKGKGNHAASDNQVTGMSGWTEKAAARVTLSGGARG